MASVGDAVKRVVTSHKEHITNTKQLVDEYANFLLDEIEKLKEDTEKIRNSQVVGDSDEEEEEEEEEEVESSKGKGKGKGKGKDTRTSKSGGADLEEWCASQTQTVKKIARLLCAQHQTAKAEIQAFEAYRNEHKSVVPSAAKVGQGKGSGSGGGSSSSSSSAAGASGEGSFPLYTEGEE